MAAARVTGVTRLRLDGLRFRHPGAEREALTGVSLEFRGGEVAWLLGAPGAGGTTLLRVAAGLAPAHTGGTLEGGVTLDGEPVHDGRRACAGGRIALIGEEPELQRSGLADTVLGEVAFGPANHGWARERILGSARTALARVGATHLADRDPRHLSGGELQRVLLAATLALEPAAWLLDEPGATLDPAGREVVRRLLREEARRGAVVVTASEDAELLHDVADRVVVLRAGAVAADGVPAEILAGEVPWEAGAGSTAAAEVARLAARLSDDQRLGVPRPLTVAEAAARWG
jgi:energy-coupling factor transporter ATP-binding protein EcfA2